MLDPSTAILLTFYFISLAGAYGAGTQYARLVRWMKGKTMPSNPKKARGLGYEASKKLDEVQFHILDADRQLEADAKTNVRSANARTSLWQAIAGIFGIKAMGTDNGEENGNGHE